MNSTAGTPDTRDSPTVETPVRSPPLEFESDGSMDESPTPPPKSIKSEPGTDNLDVADRMEDDPIPPLGNDVHSKPVDLADANSANVPSTSDLDREGKLYSSKKDYKHGVPPLGGSGDDGIVLSPPCIKKSTGEDSSSLCHVSEETVFNSAHQTTTQIYPGIFEHEIILCKHNGNCGYEA